MDYLTRIQDATTNSTPLLCYQPTGGLSVNGNLDALLSVSRVNPTKRVSTIVRFPLEPWNLEFFWFYYSEYPIICNTFTEC